MFKQLFGKGHAEFATARSHPSNPLPPSPPPSLSPLILTPTLSLALTLALTFTLTPTPRQARQQDAYEYLSHVLDQLQRAERTSAARMGEVPMAGLT